MPDNSFPTTLNIPVAISSGDSGDVLFVTDNDFDTAPSPSVIWNFNGGSNASQNGQVQWVFTPTINFTLSALGMYAGANPVFDSNGNWTSGGTGTFSSLTASNANITMESVGSSGINDLTVVDSLVVDPSANMSIDAGGNVACSNLTATGTLAVVGSQTISGKMTSYNGVATAGFGLSVVTGGVHLTGQTAAIVATNMVTVPAGNGNYIVGFSLEVTTAGTAGNIQLSIPYVSKAGNAHTHFVNVIASDLAPGNSDQEVAYMSCQGGTNIQYLVEFTGVTGAPVFSIDVSITQV